MSAEAAVEVVARPYKHFDQPRYPSKLAELSLDKQDLQSEGDPGILLKTVYDSRRLPLRHAEHLATRTLRRVTVLVQTNASL